MEKKRKEGKSFEWRFFFFFGFFFLPVFFPAQKNRGKTKTHRDHARGVLAAVLQHEQALVKLDAGRARGLVDADDAALAGDGAAAVESFGVERERRGKEVERKSTEEARLFACSAFKSPFISLMLLANDLISIGFSTEIEENNMMLLKAGLVRSSNARKKAPGSPNPFEALCERAFFFPLFFFFKTGGGSRSNIFPSIGTLPRTIHSLLTLGSGEPLQERAWRWRFAKEPAAREQKRHGLRLPPSNSATTTTPEEQSSRTSTPSLPPSSPRASPRAWRDASWKSELAARRSWRKQQSALKKERKMERGVKKKGRNAKRQSIEETALALSQHRPFFF